MQNAEQQSSTLWKRILQKRNENDAFKPIDRLYIEFDKDQFKGLRFDPMADPDLDKFITDIQEGVRKFNDYLPEEVEHYASRIYDTKPLYESEEAILVRVCVISLLM